MQQEGSIDEIRQDGRQEQEEIEAERKCSLKTTASLQLRTKSSPMPKEELLGHPHRTLSRQGRAEIRLRVDGQCQKYQTVPYHYRKALVSCLKIMADLDISERRNPGRENQFKKLALDIELRVASIPTVGGEEDVVMRILQAGEPFPLASMGLNERDYNLLLNIISKPYGIVLCVGPTGSGKTTTLHSVLAHINKPETKIWTAEDPVEITQRGLRQVQVLPKIGFDFAAAMRSFLRADPDVIMVGEMRIMKRSPRGLKRSHRTPGFQHFTPTAP
jgi:type II secretory ATPase GspE/PulE/Tfp pilus assembly ATPase PilB-like protein